MRKVIYSFILLSFALNMFAQDQSIEIGTKHSIYSEILGQERPYWIYLPNGYSEEGDPVAVMYILDGDGHFHHTSGILDFLRNQGIAPPMMMVAIPNTDDRTRDLTPTIFKDAQALENFQSAGGADDMLNFIEQELMPTIHKKYNTNTYKVLVGHSFGGIFSVNALLKKPELFNAHISISPSLWWDQQSLVDLVDSFLTKTDTLDCYYYMTMGNEGGSMLGGAMKVAALFEEKAPVNFEWDFVPMEKETHGSIPHRSTYDGLEAIFSSWYKKDLGAVYNQAGWDGVNRHYANVSEKLGVEKTPNENEINQLGYSLLRADAVKSALEVFKENINRYPESYNVYDSYAEALLENGDQKQAIKYYHKSLEIFPGNTNAVDKLTELGESFDVSELFISLPQDQLKKYTGEFVIDIGLVASVILEEGQLYLVGEQIPKEQLMPFGNHKFCLEQSRFYLEFTESNDQITGFKAQLNGGQRASAIKKP